jgi:hypothetical protein
MVSTRWTVVAAMLAALAGCREERDERAAAPQPAPCAIAPAPSVAAAPPSTPAPAAPAPAASSALGPAASAHPGAVARPADKASADAARVVVKRLVVARGVERKDREPVDPGTTFHAADLGKLYAFVELDNAAGLPSEIVVAFEPPEGPALGNVRLAIGASPHWRTWAFTRAARKAGTWTAVVKSADGQVLARAPFDIVS